MKKILLMTLVAAVGAAWADDAATGAATGDVTIEAGNVIGILPVTGTSETTSEMTLPVPFVGIGSTAKDPKNLTLAEALYADNLQFPETVKVCINSSRSYYTDWLIMVGLGTKVGDFYPSSRVEDGYSVVAPSADKQEIPYGTGLTFTGLKTSETAYVYGQYDADAATRQMTVSSATADGVRSTRFVNPMDTAFSIERIKGNDGDIVIAYDKNGAQSIYYYSSSGANGLHWYTQTPSGYKKVGKTYLPQYKINYPSPSVGEGDSFSYVNNGAEVSFTWVDSVTASSGE